VAFPGSVRGSACGDKKRAGYFGGAREVKKEGEELQRSRSDGLNGGEDFWQKEGRREGLVGAFRVGEEFREKRARSVGGEVGGRPDHFEGNLEQRGGGSLLR